MGERKKVVAGEGKNGSTAGLYAGNRNQIHDSEAAEGEEDGRGTAHAIEEELSNLNVGNVSFGRVTAWKLGMEDLTGWPLGLLIRSLGLPMQTTNTRLNKNPITYVKVVACAMALGTTI